MGCCEQNQRDADSHWIWCKERPPRPCLCGCGNLSIRGWPFFSDHTVHGHIALQDPKCKCAACMAQNRIYATPWWIVLPCWIADLTLGIARGVRQITKAVSGKGMKAVR